MEYYVTLNLFHTVLLLSILIRREYRRQKTVKGEDIEKAVRERGQRKPSERSK